MKTIKLGNQELDFTVPAVMGILNVTPDSFYDGGRYLSEVKIVERIHQIMDEGADMIDVGAYSTRPGADYVDDREEIRRLLQAVELIRFDRYFPGKSSRRNRRCSGTCYRERYFGRNDG